MQPGRMKSNTAAVLVFASSASAFWRMECRERVALGRMDPLVNPGELSAHAHTIHGSSGFNLDTDYEQLRDGNCTSCAVTQDKSAYWTPVPYFQDEETGEFEMVDQVGGMLAYYLLYSMGDEKVTAFPEGFRMIAGETSRRNYSEALGDVTLPDPAKSLWAALGQTSQKDLAERALGFNCLDYSKAPEGSLYRHYMPDKKYLDENCPDGVRFEIMFPSCWNGEDVDSDNHQDHVAYPDLVMSGNCPDGYPVRLISLFFETIWATNKFKGRNGKFVMSNGDPQGFGYHADFMTGWDVDFLQEAADTCTDPSGEIEKCAIFDIDRETPATCRIDENGPDFANVRIAQKDLTGPLKNLPGDVPIQYGPEPANHHHPVATTSRPLPTDATYKPGTTVGESGTIGVGGIFLETGGEAASTSATSSPVEAPEPTDIIAPKVNAKPATTSAPSLAGEAPDTYIPMTTKYVTVSGVVSEVVWEEAIVYVTEYPDGSPVTLQAEATPTATRSGLHARRDGARNHLHHHRRGHGAGMH